MSPAPTTPPVFWIQSGRVEVDPYWTQPGLSQYDAQRSLPLVFVECPAGHSWAKIDPRWLRPTGYRLTKRSWCPDHQDECRAHIARVIQKTKSQTAREFDRLPLPPSRVCTGKNPKSHELGAVLPIDQFYLRPSKLRKDGSQGIYVTPSCKACCVQRSSERRNSLDINTKRRYERNRYRNRKTKGDSDKARVSKVNADLFLEWALWIKPTYTPAEERRISEAKADNNMLSLRIIDQIMTRYGATDQYNVFYS